MKKLNYGIMILISIFMLAACSSDKDEKETEMKQEDMKVEQEDNNQEEEEEEPPEETDEVEEEELPTGEIKYSLLENEARPVEELDEKQWLKIDSEELVGEKIIYGAGEIVTFFLNHTYRYEVDSEKKLWESRITSPNELVSLEDGVALTHGFKIRELRLKDGKTMNEIAFEEGDSEDDIQYNDTYRLGSMKEVIRLTNLKTGEITDLTEVAEVGEYVETILLESVTATEKDNIVTTFDNETGEVLAEEEYPGATDIFKRAGTDDLYIVYSPVENQYGRDILLVDGKTLNVKNEIFVKNANGPAMVTDSQVFYYDVINGELVALSLDLDAESYRFEIGGENLEYGIDEYSVSGDKLYLQINEMGDIENHRVLEIDSAAGEVEQYIVFPSFNLYDFYELDGKLYLKFETKDGYFYYIVDQEDVHRSMDK